MSEQDPHDDATQDLVRAVQPIQEELLSRLRADLDERDLCAVSTAITKAAISCFLLGTAAATYGYRKRWEELIEAGVLPPGEPPAVYVEGIEPTAMDLWVESYGDDVDDSA
jgi:hypothetical protein